MECDQRREVIIPRAIILVHRTRKTTGKTTGKKKLNADISRVSVKKKKNFSLNVMKF